MKYVPPGRVFHTSPSMWRISASCVSMHHVAWSGSATCTPQLSGGGHAGSGRGTCRAHGSAICAGGCATASGSACAQPNASFCRSGVFGGRAAAPYTGARSRCAASTPIWRTDGGICRTSQGPPRTTRTDSTEPTINPKGSQSRKRPVRRRARRKRSTCPCRTTILGGFHRRDVPSVGPFVLMRFSSMPAPFPSRFPAQAPSKASLEERNPDRDGRGSLKPCPTGPRPSSWLPRRPRPPRRSRRPSGCCPCR